MGNYNLGGKVRFGVHHMPTFPEFEVVDLTTGLDLSPVIGSDFFYNVLKGVLALNAGLDPDEYEAVVWAPWELIGDIRAAVAIGSTLRTGDDVYGLCFDLKRVADACSEFSEYRSQARNVVSKYRARWQASIAKIKLTADRRKDFNTNRKALVLKILAEGKEYRCQARGCTVVRELSVDHIVPLSKGGTDDLENLQFMCRPHNSQKGDLYD